jgi:uncharacterized paraquat-inducible protein A
MPRWEDPDDEWDEDLDPEDDESPRRGAEPEPTVRCPHCHQGIYEDTPRCPHCGSYLADDDSLLVRKPWWILIGVAICLYLVYQWLAG